MAVGSRISSAVARDFAHIPVIDIGPLRLDDAAARLAVARQIDQACRHVGFFYVGNHGVPQPVIDDVMAAARRFFALPLAEKMAITSGKSLQHRGYVAMATEQHNKEKRRTELHEAIDFGRETRDGAAPPDLQRSLYGPNQWPDTLPALRPAVGAYCNALYRLGDDLLRGFALALDLDEGWFLPKFDWAAGWLRVLHYPPQATADDDSQIGVGEHTDYECITVLLQDENAGLQVLNQRGEWIAAPPIPGTFVVNIGDLMARWTNDRYRSTMHRAINLSGRERYSMPFFLGANAETVVECVPTCRGPGQTPIYAPVRCADWVLRRVADLQPFLAPTQETAPAP